MPAYKYRGRRGLFFNSDDLDTAVLRGLIKECDYGPQARISLLPSRPVTAVDE